LKKNKNSNDAKAILWRFVSAVIIVVILVTSKHFILRYHINNIYESTKIAEQEHTDTVNDQIKLIDRAETISYVIILSLVIFLTLFIFMPALRGLSKAFSDIEESNGNIMKLFKIVHGAIFLIDQKTTQIMLMNKQAERLINAENTDIIYLKEHFQFMSQDFCDVMEMFKNNEQNENMTLQIIVNGNEKMHVIVTTVKTYFNKKAAILIGLFDISEQKQTEEAFKTLAITDKLTGLYNRFYFVKRVNDEIEIADKYGEPISMMLLDLDHFKNINDTWGHPVGDEVLKQTADTLTGATRKSDFVFRVGGEEFVVLMPKTNILAAEVVAEKIRKALELVDHPVAGKITASIGVAERIKNELLDDWYKRVDKALYCAKEGGRNCVVNFEKSSHPATIHIEWKKEWECGNKIIDRQHKELVEYGNSLLFMKISNYESNKVLNQIDKLLTHVDAHFKYEEQVLLEVNYPHYEEHAEIHKNILDKAIELKKIFLDGRLNTTSFISFVMDDMVIGHMIGEDAKYFSYTSKSEIS